VMFMGLIGLKTRVSARGRAGRVHENAFCRDFS
jgi:hypothetical protein